MNILIKKTNNSDKAYDIASKLTDYFNEEGLRSIKEDVQNHILFGAYDNKEMIGFITYKEINPEAVEITWTAIVPEYQGKGIGSQLISESLKNLSTKYKVCEVKTLSEDHPDEGYAKTRNFYKKVGFIPLETISPYPGWGEDNPCQIFVKFIN